MPHTNIILVDNMTNKKLTLICLTMIIILIAPSINAISVNKTTNESIKPEKDRYFYLDQDIDEGVKQRTNEDITNTNKGRIYGYTVSSYAYYWNPISNVIVTTGIAGKSTISDGSYSISDLPLNTPIKVTARKIGYYSERTTVTLTNDDPEEYLILNLQPVTVKSKEKNIAGNMIDLIRSTFHGLNLQGIVTKSEEVYLSSSEPNEEVFLMFNENDEKIRNRKSRSPEETTCLGSVYGQVRYSPDGYYGDMPAPHTLVKIGDKFDVSSLLKGAYRINGLPLDQTYTITYSNRKFKTKTTTITLTKEKPNAEVYLFYYSDDERFASYDNYPTIFNHKILCDCLTSNHCTHKPARCELVI